MIPVLIDCDPGQDDAIALLLALASPELEVLGVTTVAGNQTIDKVTANALRVLELAGRSDVPVAAGADRPLVGELVVAADAHGETGLDGPDLPPPQGSPVEQHAVEFLAERLLASERPVTVVPLGPLTNVALLLAERPEAADRIERIVLMGGAIAEGNMTPSAEFNIWVDPEAAAYVFESGLDVTMVGLDVTNRAVLTPEHADRLRPQGRVGEAVAAMLDFYGAFYREAYDHGGMPRPRRARGGACGPPGARHHARATRRGRRLGRHLPRAHGGGHAAPNGPAGAERQGRRRRRCARVHRASTRASAPTSCLRLRLSR